MKASITTDSGAVVRVEMEAAPRYGAGGRQAVELYQGRVLVGRGYVVRCADGSVRIEDSDARLGAEDGSESEAAYRALEEALSAELGPLPSLADALEGVTVEQLGSVADAHDLAAFRAAVRQAWGAEPPATEAEAEQLVERVWKENRRWAREAAIRRAAAPKGGAR